MPEGTAATPAAAPVKYQKKDFQTDQEVRWCPGCGDYAILNAVQIAFAGLGIPREKFVVVSGIGCSSRLPYYVNTYGFHGIHGRAPAIATGVKIANPELQVWVGTGDGDALSIGGNHILHSMRRNADIKVLLFNNRIYGLTKGQYSPTSELGKRNVSAPLGTVERPINPISIAIAAGATFIARSVDVYSKHLQEVLTRAARHKGAAFIEILQNCNVFNDQAFDNLTVREVRDDANVQLEHGKPLIFGKNKDMGLRLKNNFEIDVVKLGENGITEKDLIVHDEKCSHSGYAFLMSRIVAQQYCPQCGNWIEPTQEYRCVDSNVPMQMKRKGCGYQVPLAQRFPMPIGVFRHVEMPTLDERIHAQIRDARQKQGEGDLKSLINSGDTWEVK